MKTLIALRFSKSNFGFRDSAARKSATERHDWKACEKRAIEEHDWNAWEKRGTVRGLCSGEACVKTIAARR